MREFLQELLLPASSPASRQRFKTLACPESLCFRMLLCALREEVESTLTPLSQADNTVCFCLSLNVSCWTSVIMCPPRPPKKTNQRRKEYYENQWGEKACLTPYATGLSVTFHNEPFSSLTPSQQNPRPVQNSGWPGGKPQLFASQLSGGSAFAAGRRL